MIRQRVSRVRSVLKLTRTSSRTPVQIRNSIAGSRFSIVKFIKSVQCNTRAVSTGLFRHDVVGMYCS
jgi:hypothetical protein